MFPVASEGWKEQILFRDYLNQNPDLAREYERLKLKLMNEFPGNRFQYTQHKASFIKSVLEKAKKEKGLLSEDNG
ncbi:MAG: GrpB family protein [Clostridia bacterium]|nr:GrpB family protein [Clostridia bacterium]